MQIIEKVVSETLSRLKIALAIAKFKLAVAKVVLTTSLFVDD